MIPMFRTRSSGWVRLLLILFVFSLAHDGDRALSPVAEEARLVWGAHPPVVRGELPAVVRVGLVGLGHLVHVLLALDRAADAVVGVEELGRQALCHGALAAVASEADDPADGHGGCPPGAHLR